MSSCPHRNELERLQPPKLSQSVHREECTQCFDNQDGDTGVDVCLICFNGACLDQTRHHASTHVSRSGHSFTLNIKRTPKSKPPSRGDREPPAKMTKLAIVQEREEDKWEHHTSLKCWKCDPGEGKVIVADVDTVKRLTDGVMESLSSARQSEVQAWEEEITACEHTLLLEQYATGNIPAEGLAHCASCELTSNLWLCLACGALGCGRPQYGGTGGNGHALEHFNSTQHPVCVKLGTITPEGGADIYCYACNDARIDPELPTHLATFGINVASQKKFEKSMTELQIEQNLAFDFSLTAEDGSALRPVFGPGLTGLRNLGNSCYMASVLQVLFSLTQFQQRYYGEVLTGAILDGVFERAATHWETCSQSLPADCLECQMLKVADGLLSGRYSKLHAETHAPWQAGLRLAGFKALVGKGHAEFATMRQQDAEEFFGHLLTVLRRFNHQINSDEGEPMEAFAFGLEQRLQCLSCSKVRYRVDNMDVLSFGVPAQEFPADTGSELMQCLGLLLGATGQEELEYQCEGGCGKVSAVRLLRFSTFPDILVLHAKKFQLKNWVPTKLDIPIILPEGDELVLDAFLGHGLQPDEEQLPESSSDSSPSSLPQFNAEALAQLEGMGFPLVRCQRALFATQNQDVEAAMEWLFSPYGRSCSLYPHESDIDEPIQFKLSGANKAPEPSSEQIAMLADMGFTHAQARKALIETKRAVEWLFNHSDDTGEIAPSSSVPSRLPARYRLKAFISHKGPSVHSGHYNGEWVLFNDEKVVVADKTSVDELKNLAYMYIFERI
ncbi:hypothetical protein F5J12DRAFT_902429 [Pisolithus orientalis]|uniref:uncharacterized protein n=1 Tax=Pisolithus orientalis TaxID=936130 RepID=UPI00222559F1|nr:uncharacterized protein F5J12DRAFT_902429 [Pisolithus orientalis]KAI6032578.1 hypothetical protein F5J12DRAFT_902429 [Pisolithus orientalis]